eukprot:TRINITY_DN304_c0_g4_i1.p1 TRINITY_DN304_c0_g4~~TRINITY_DN304_c0_g4_i1.p1  ORF type:complete len:415 (+),score=131.30 TRINITY_DN304_c0_g4_i1:61-1305(+)
MKKTQKMQNLNFLKLLCFLSFQFSILNCLHPVFQPETAIKGGYCDNINTFVSTFKIGEGASVPDVTKNFSPLELQLVDPLTHAWGAIEGRSPSFHLGTLGGLPGEWLLNYIIFQKRTEKDFSYEVVKNYFFKYLNEKHDHKTAFFINMEQSIFTKLQQEINTKVGISNFDWTIQLTESQKKQILNILTNSQFIGNSYLRLLNSNYNTYEVNENISKNFLLAFYNYIWENPNKNVSVFIHEDLISKITAGSIRDAAIVFVKSRHDSAYLDVNLSRQDKCKNLAPASKAAMTTELLMDHRKFIEPLRNKIVTFFAVEETGISNITDEENLHLIESMKAEVSIVSSKHLNITIESIAKKLVQYEAEVVYAFKPWTLARLVSVSIVFLLVILLISFSGAVVYSVIREEKFRKEFNQSN